MPAFIKDLGSWKSVKNIFVKDSGSWKSVKGGWVKDNGIWKRFFSSGPPVPTSLTTSIVNLPNARDYMFAATNGIDRIVLVNNSGDNTGFAVTTTNGTTWTESPLPNLSPISVGYTSIKYGNGVYIACGFESSIVAKSTNGINWSTTGLATYTGGFYDIEYGQGNFVMTDNYGIANISSNDGATWSVANNFFKNNNWGVAFGNNTWVGYTATDYYDPSTLGFYYSNNVGATFARTNLPSLINHYSTPVSFANNMFFSYIFDGPSRAINGLYYSSNGISWSKATGSITTVAYEQYTNIAYGDGVYMCFDRNRKGLLWSIDGMSWNFYTDANTSSSSAVSVMYRLMCYCPGLGFFVAKGGKVLRASPVF